MAKKKVVKRKAPKKKCPGCNKQVASATRTCACGHVFTPAKKKAAKAPAFSGVAETIKTAKSLINQAGSVENAIEILKQFDD